MGKTKCSIALAYQTARTQAERLDRIAREVDGQRGNVAGLKNRLSGYWTGANADAYRMKMDARGDELERIASDLRSIASGIRKVAESAYQADMRAAELARQKDKPVLEARPCMAANMVLWQKGGGGGGGGGGGR